MPFVIIPPYFDMDIVYLSIPINLHQIHLSVVPPRQVTNLVLTAKLLRIRHAAILPPLKTTIGHLAFLQAFLRVVPSARRFQRGVRGTPNGKAGRVRRAPLAVVRGATNGGVAGRFAAFASRFGVEAGVGAQVFQVGGCLGIIFWKAGWIGLEILTGCVERARIGGNVLARRWVHDAAYGLLALF